MKKSLFAFLALSVFLTGCDDKIENSSSEQPQSFEGNWKAVSKADGSALHPKFSSILNITCSSASCHVVSKKRSVLSDEELVSNSDWNIKDASTLMKGNDMASIYVKDGKLIASDFIYEHQKE